MRRGRMVMVFWRIGRVELGVGSRRIVGMSLMTIMLKILLRSMMITILKKRLLITLR